MLNTIDRKGDELRANTLTTKKVAWIGNDRDGKIGKTKDALSVISERAFYLG